MIVLVGLLSMPAYADAEGIAWSRRRFVLSAMSLVESVSLWSYSKNTAKGRMALGTARSRTGTATRLIYRNNEADRTVLATA
jgi:hypothetical protein